MLKFGMLWSYNKKDDLQSEINRAVVYYRAKYHNGPSAVYLNPAEVGELYNVGGIPVRPDRTVLKGNIFVAADHEPAHP